MALPVFVSDDLVIGIKSSAAQLTPSQGFQLAERLIRSSTRAMIAEEAGTPEQPLAKRSVKRGQ